MRNSSASTRSGGFTLLELMVTMAVLSVILVMCLQVTQSSRNAIRVSEARSEHDAIARKAFAPLTEDLAGMVTRADARIEFDNRPGDDKISFLTTRSGITADNAVGKRAVSLVRYAMVADPTFGTRLVRGSLGHDYEDSASSALDLNPDKAFPQIPTANEQAVSKNLLRFEVEYLVAETAGVKRQITAPTTLANLRGIVITLATIDDRSLQAVKPSVFTSLAARFPDASLSADTLAEWSRIRDGLARSGTAGVPRDVLAALRCYQRTFLIP